MEGREPGLSEWTSKAAPCWRLLGVLKPQQGCQKCTREIIDAFLCLLILNWLGTYNAGRLARSLCVPGSSRAEPESGRDVLYCAGSCAASVDSSRATLETLDCSQNW